MDAHHQQIIGDGNVVSSLVFQSSNEMAFTAQYEGGRREGTGRYVLLMGIKQPLSRD